MGFKRTSEGRVFFQGLDDAGANDMAMTGASKPLSSSSSHPNAAPSSRPLSNGLGSEYTGNSQTQIQIVTLLKALNERLKATQAERNNMRQELDAYKNLIADLEDKAERGEKAYVQLEQKLSRAADTKNSAKSAEMAKDALAEMAETRKLLLALEGKSAAFDREVQALKSNVERHQQVGSQLLQKQTALENTQQQQAQKVADHSQIASKIVQRIKDGEQRVEDMGAKLEQTSTEQARIGRKLEKAIEERARFMRKIERIEETVIQTRDALNARAMVLLTDQNVADEHEHSAPAQSPAAPSNTPAPIAEKAKGPIFIKAPKPSLTSTQLKMVAGGVAGILLLSAGAFALMVARPNLFEPTPSYKVPSTQSALTPRLGDADTAATTNSTNAALLNEIQRIEDMEWQIRQKAKADTVEENIDTVKKPAVSTLPSDSEPEETSDQQPPGQQVAAVEFNDDIGTLNLNGPEAVKAALDGDVDKIAQALNNIEPNKAASLELTPSQPIDKVQDPRKLVKADKSLPDNIKDLEEQAFEGKAEAQHDLAALYTAGQAGVEQDFERARFWFEQSSARGVDNAAYNLGVLYHQGLGVRADLGKALGYYELAASHGHPEAQYNLGIAYIEGIGVSYDAERAAGYFQKAAQNGIMEAAYNLGLIYENGLLGSSNPGEALVWYKIAADQGSPEAKQALQQLAKTLDIDEDSVNRLAESMKTSSAITSGPAMRAVSTVPDQSITNQYRLAEIQKFLMKEGLYPGPADGVMGPLTADAIKTYQRQNKMAVNGAITSELIEHMHLN